MKKIINLVAASAVVTTLASADFARVEAGVGVWQQTPSGYANTGNDNFLGLEGDYKSAKKESNEVYAWMLIKHPLPIIPNLRLEYVTISDIGKTSGLVAGITIPGSAPTTFNMTQYDIIPYYNLLDNTFWMTFDVGLDVKIIQSDSNIGSLGIFPGYSSSDTTAVPLLYLRTRAELPSTNIGLEADVKAITDGKNTMYDARAKIDYTFDFVPVIQPALEVGYRIQKIKTDDGDTQVDLDYSGFYAGLMLRF